MKTSKLIIFNILTYIAALVTAYLYFGGGYPGGFSTSLIMPVLLITLMFTTVLLSNLSYVVSRALHKKNLLRVSILILALLTVFSVIARILEAVRASVCGICLISTLLYIVLLVINITMLRDLHELIEDLFKYQ